MQVILECLFVIDARRFSPATLIKNRSSKKKLRRTLLREIDVEAVASRVSV